MIFLKKIFKRKPKFKLQNDHIIKEAFTCGGVTYFQFDDIFNVPFERALTALDFYEELRMRTSRDLLLLHIVAVDDALNKGELTTVAKLNQQLKERLEWIIEPDLLYKLASVVFFDKNESPYIYDYKYGQEKIKNWKKESNVNAFFLQMPLIKLVPFLQDCEIDFQAYSIMVKKITKAHLENISTNLSSEKKQTGSVKDLISRLETQQN